ncbi:MAG TPA: class I SAM-dependent methyltransferase [Ktedonobacteraceae bacterium]|nr:class I SAM-dependent methyltransferase [Ktedonobacteraceae bacterium]
MRFFQRKPRKNKKRQEALAVARQGLPQHTAPMTRIIDGRRYYESAPYTLPKDLQDIHRLDFQHYMLRCAMRGNYLAPLDATSTHNVLDVGCGSGRWGIEMAQAFPNTQVIGVDLEPAGSEGVEIPANYQFQQANVLHGLPFADQTFDYVHQRLLIMGIPKSQWITELQEVLRITRPGGWLELLESGTTFMPAGELTQRWCEWGMRVSAARGLDPSAAPNLARFARQAGIQQVQSYMFDIPVGNWGSILRGWEGRMGLMQLMNLRALYQSGLPLLKSELHIDELTLHTMLPRLEEEWARLHTKLRYFVVIGRKVEARDRPTRQTIHLTPPFETRKER